MLIRSTDEAAALIRELAEDRARRVADAQRADTAGETADGPVRFPPLKGRPILPAGLSGRTPHGATSEFRPAHTAYPEAKPTPFVGRKAPASSLLPRAPRYPIFASPGRPLSTLALDVVREACEVAARKGTAETPVTALEVFHAALLQEQHLPLMRGVAADTLPPTHAVQVALPSPDLRGLCALCDAPTTHLVARHPSAPLPGSVSRWPSDDPAAALVFRSCHSHVEFLTSAIVNGSL